MEPATGTIAPPSFALTRTSARRWLVLVGVAYASFQLVLFDVDRAPSWDEAIYLSQVAPGADAYNFTASRARGITVLVAPLAADGSMQPVRLGLALLAAVALVGAFLPWIASIDAAAAAGAAFFASTWTALLYGSEVMPNLWVAFAGVGALGFATRSSKGPSAGRDDLAAAALLFVAALFRPFDAVLLAAAAALAALFVGGRSLRSAALLAGAAAAGCLPWLVEMATRYGGVDAAFAQAVAVAHVTVPAPWERVVQYLATADGPTIGPVADPGVPVPGLLTVVVCTLAAGAGVVGARATSRFGPLASSPAVAASFAAAYVAVVGGVAPRFLTPALALLALSVGGGVLVLWRRARGGTLRAILLVSVLAWPVWQASVAVRLESSAVRQRAGLRDLGSRIRTLTDGHACVVASVVGAPQIGYAAGCRGRPVVDVRSVDRVLREEEGRGVAVVFLVVGSPLDREPPGISGRWSVEEPATGPVTIYRVDLA